MTAYIMHPAWKQYPMEAIIIMGRQLVMHPTWKQYPMETIIIGKQDQEMPKSDVQHFWVASGYL
jgi:hypothetical protein